MSLTGYFIIGTLVAAIGLNIWWFFDGVPHTSISYHVVIAAAVTVLVPALLGTLNGHWLMPSVWEMPYGFWVLIGLAALTLAFEVYTGWWLAAHTHPLQPFFFYLAIAPTLWPMGPDPA